LPPVPEGEKGTTSGITIVKKSRTSRARLNEAVREKYERLRRERDIVALREYFSRRRGELRAVNRELRQVARAIDED
jgi:hypothetical protein